MTSYRKRTFRDCCAAEPPEADALRDVRARRTPARLFAPPVYPHDLQNLLR
jgi:hypothetical protein